MFDQSTERRDMDYGEWKKMCPVKNSWKLAYNASQIELLQKDLLLFKMNI